VKANDAQSKSFFMRLKIKEADKSSHNYSYIRSTVGIFRWNFRGVKFALWEATGERPIRLFNRLAMKTLKKLADVPL